MSLTKKELNKRLATIQKVKEFIESQDIEDMEIVSYGAEKIYEMTTSKESQPFYAFFQWFRAKYSRQGCYHGKPVDIFRQIELNP